MALKKQSNFIPQGIKKKKTKVKDNGRKVKEEIKTYEQLYANIPMDNLE